jgi:hypothetical protein
MTRPQEKRSAVMSPAEKVEASLWSLLDEIAANGTGDVERADVEWLEDGTRITEGYDALVTALQAAQQRLGLIDGNDEPAIAVRLLIGDALSKAVPRE